MRRWGSSRTTSEAEYSANHGLVFPPLSRKKPTKREMAEEKLASIPLDLSSSSSSETVVNQERNVSSAASSHETVVEDNLLSSADDKALGNSTVLDHVSETAEVVEVTQEGNLVTPCDVTERRNEDNLLFPTVAELYQTGNKDWSPADDEETYSQLKVWPLYRKNRLQVFTQFDVAETPLSSGKGTKVESSPKAANPPAQGSTTTPPLSVSGTATHASSSSAVDGKLPEPETTATTVAPKPDSSSPRADHPPAQGSTTTPPLSVSGTANLNYTATHASSSSSFVDGKLPEPETTTTTVAPKPDSSSPRADQNNPAGSTTPHLSETTTRASSSSESTVSLALFPPLTGEIQSKKQTRNAHLAP